MMLFSDKCAESLLWIIASAARDKVGNKAIGLYIEGSDFKPDLFQSAVTWAILKISGKCPISKQLLNNLDKLKEIGVAIMLMKRPEIPQWEKFDFLSCLRILETSMGDVFILDKLHEIESIGSSSGTGSSLPWTVAFETKRSLRCSL